MKVHEENQNIIAESKNILEEIDTLTNARKKEFIVFFLMGVIPWVTLATGLSIGTALVLFAAFIQLFGMVALIVTGVSWIITVRNKQNEIDKFLDKVEANIAKM